ncbi:MAG: GGDEF domain-containing protein [Mycobacteriales bacterium]
MSAARTISADLLPLDERLHYLRAVRITLVAAAAGFILLSRPSLVDPISWLWVGGACYVALALVAELVWWVTGRQGLWIFGLLVMVDGTFLTWCLYETGSAQDPLRYLIFVQLAAVALLASHRTALKVAFWDSMLTLVVYYARQAGLLQAIPGGHSGATLAYHQTVEFIVAFWLLTLMICSLAAVNERELRRRRYDMEALASMGRALQDAGTATAVARVLTDSLHSTFDFPRLAVFDAPERGYRLLGSVGMQDALVEDLHLAEKSELVRVAVRRSPSLLAELDPDRDPWLHNAMPGARNMLFLPLVAEGRTVAVLLAESGLRRGARIQRRVVGTAERFVAHAALALRNAMLQEQMQEMAATDALTTLANRRSLDAALAREIARAARIQSRLSLVMLDIDHFKKLNDTHGHLTGDNVLRQVAKRLRECGREYDTVARYGGEEFAVVLPGCSEQIALQVAERLRAAVAAAETEVPVTVSAGVATFPQDARDSLELIQAADEALYHAKRAGRDQVASAETARQGRVADQALISVSTQSSHQSLESP